MWAVEIDDRRLRYQNEIKRKQDSIRKDTGPFVPISANEISAESDNLTILKYRLQNAEYMNNILMLGMWYFGAQYSYWKTDRDLIDPHKLANVIHNEMPWIIDNQSYDKLNVTNLSSGDFKNEIDINNYIDHVTHTYTATVQDVMNDYADYVVPHVS